MFVGLSLKILTALQVIERRESVMMEEDKNEDKDTFSLNQLATSRKTGSEFLQEAYRWISDYFQYLKNPTQQDHQGRMKHQEFNRSKCLDDASPPPHPLLRS